VPEGHEHSPDLEQLGLVEVLDGSGRLTTASRKPRRGRARTRRCEAIGVCITAITTLGTNTNKTFQQVGAQVGAAGS